jgi:hypothetical protein
MSITSGCFPSSTHFTLREKLLSVFALFAMFWLEQRWIQLTSYRTTLADTILPPSSSGLLPAPRNSGSSHELIYLSPLHSRSISSYSSMA